MIFISLPIALACAALIFWAWLVTAGELGETQLAAWRRTISLVSVTAATILAPLPYVLVFLINDPHTRWVGWIEGIAGGLTAVALPTSLMRKGATRWALALASIFFFLLTSFLYAVTGLTF